MLHQNAGRAQTVLATNVSTNKSKSRVYTKLECQTEHNIIPLEPTTSSKSASNESIFHNKKNLVWHSYCSKPRITRPTHQAIPYSYLYHILYWGSFCRGFRWPYDSLRWPTPPGRFLSVGGCSALGFPVFVLPPLSLFS